MGRRLLILFVASLRCAEQLTEGREGKLLGWPFPFLIFMSAGTPLTFVMLSCSIRSRSLTKKEKKRSSPSIYRSSQMKFVVVIAVVAAFLVVGTHGRFAIDPFPVNRETFQEWTCSSGNVEHCVNVAQDNFKVMMGKSVLHMRSMFSSVSTWISLFKESKSFITSFSEWKNLFTNGNIPTLGQIGSAIRAARKPYAGSSNTSYPYFSWIPMPVGDAIPDGDAVQFSTPCFGSVVATASSMNDTYVVLTITTSNQLAWFCSDAYMLVGGGSLSFQELDEEKTYTIGFDVSGGVSTTAGKWYLQQTGIRMLKFRDNLVDTVGELVDTVVLLSGFAINPIPAETLQANIDFIQNYIEASPRLQPKTQLRSAGAVVANGIDPSYIQSGDALLVLRPDGLDPMIGWGEGDTVGHSTVALWINGELNVCESTTKDAYWPTNGIQCHKYAEWIDLCVQAGHNVVLVPLAPSFASAFDQSKAYDFFLANQGLDYGFQVFLFGWLDTASQNFPCVPSDYTVCLTATAAEVIAVLLDNIMGGTPENIFRQALQHRVNLWPGDASVLDCLMTGQQQLSMNFTDLYMAVERDDWVYNTTKFGDAAVGRAMVCCVFVCNLWKAAGVFGNLTHEIQCGEQTLWDIFSMQIFDDTKMGSGRPEICKQYDPDNQLCQLTGNLTLYLKPDVNTRPLYAGMGERCSSKGPNYVRQPGC
jgi:hypothetical protein